jgi:hypothetical protein
MPVSSITNGLTIFFSITTSVVLLYPLIKLVPSWLERRASKKAAFHRAALVAIELAMAHSGQDAAKGDRLTEQREFHRRALRSLSTGTTSPTVTGPLPIDLAA